MEDAKERLRHSWLAEQGEEARDLLVAAVALREAGQLDQSTKVASMTPYPTVECACLTVLYAAFDHQGPPRADWAVYMRAVARSSPPTRPRVVLLILAWT